jgi:hypothetical protein
MHVRNFVATASAVLVFALNLAAQSVAVNPVGSQSMTAQVFGTPWEEGSAQNTTLLLRNLGSVGRTTANIVMYSPNGQQQRTAQVNITGNTVQRISLGNLLQSTNGSIQWGGLALESTGPVQGRLVIADAQTGAVQYVSLQAGDAFDTESALHASWWLPDPGTRGLVTLFNSSSQSIVVTPSVVTEGTGGKEQGLAGVALAPHASMQLDLVKDLLSQNKSAATAMLGSLVLRYTGPAHALQPSFFIANPATGFLVQPVFQAKHDGAIAAGTATWQFPAISLQDPTQAGVGTGEAMTGYALLSNGTSAALQPELIAYFGSGAAATKAQSTKVTLPLTALQAGEVRLVNLSQVGQGLIPAGVTHLGLTISHAGAAGDLGVTVVTANQAMSVARTATGVLLPSGISDSSFWDISTRPVILPTIKHQGAPGNSTVQAVVYYADAWGIGSYELSQVSVAGTKVLGLRSAVLSNIPDQNGSTLPAGATYGLVTVGGAQSSTQGATVAAAGCGSGCDSTATPSALPLQAEAKASSVNVILAPHSPQTGTAAPACEAEPPPSCPSTISVSSSTVVPLKNGSSNSQRTFPYLHSGLGSLFYLLVGPSTTDWAGTKITESFSSINSGCKSPVPTPCHGDSTFTVGQGSSGTSFGLTISAQKNTFWDFHVMGSNVDWLGESGQTGGCTITCTQTYSCDGKAIANFTIKYTLSHGTLSGQAVTNVQSSETAQ